MNRRLVGGTLLSVVLITLGVSIWLWWKAWSAPLIHVITHPVYSVHGITAGAPVRMQGIVIGQVASVGLSMDAEGQLRPELSLSLNPETMANRGLAARLRAQHLQEEVARGLRVHLVALNLASDQLQVELFWNPDAELPTGLAANEIPAVGAGTRQNVERLLQLLNRATERNLATLAAELEGDLDKYFPQTDPALAAEWSARWVTRTAEVAELTEPDVLMVGMQRVEKACADLRTSTEAARQDDGLNSVVRLRKSLAEATAAFDALAVRLESSQAKLNVTATDMTDLFKLISKGAREWHRKTQALSTEPQPP